MNDQKAEGSGIGKRCGWVTTDPLYLAYHDTEWGVPSHDDRHLFEMLVLEGAQAGLSWITILRKREGYLRAFANFDPVRVSAFKPKDIERLLTNEEIVRNRAKITAAIDLAKAVLIIQKEHGSLAAFLWSFPGNKVIQNRWKNYREAPASTPVSDAMSKALKGYGCKFVGSTILYAFMQAVGMVNDHVTTCERYQELAGKQK
jgi:DNA-3-methyladenine glycosylase I